jgi:hypothetical protein
MAHHMQTKIFTQLWWTRIQAQKYISKIHTAMCINKTCIKHNKTYETTLCVLEFQVTKKYLKPQLLDFITNPQISQTQFTPKLFSSYNTQSCINPS